MNTSKRATLCKWLFSVCDWRLHHHHHHLISRLRQGATEPNRLCQKGVESYTSYIWEIKVWDETYFAMVDNLPYYIALLLCQQLSSVQPMPQLRSHTQISAAPWHGTYSTQTWTISYLKCIHISNMYSEQFVILWCCREHGTATADAHAKHRWC